MNHRERRALQHAPFSQNRWMYNDIYHTRLSVERDIFDSLEYMEIGYADANTYPFGHETHLDYDIYIHNPFHRIEGPLFSTLFEEWDFQ